MSQRPRILPLNTDSLRAIAHTLPELPGVYHFIGEKNHPIYIGKSINLRQRVLSHLYAASRDLKENKIVASTRRISVQTTTGELGALILESVQIKQLLPLYNRRLRRQKMLFTWTLNKDNPFQKLDICEATWPPHANRPYFGLYSSMRRAKNRLLQVATEYNLCKKCLGLEPSGGTCFGYQLKKCLGACRGDETSDSHNARLHRALKVHAVDPWPFSGPIGIVEGQADSAYIFNQWNYFGMAPTTILNQRTLNLEAPNCALDRDTYQILASTLANRSDNLHIIPLDSG